MRLDLHVHSTFSDGDYTPGQVADMARAAGLDGFALTDHDECRGFGELERVSGLVLIPGMEISAHEGDSEVHVLGLGIDWRHEAVAGYAKRAMERRHNRAAAVAQKLRTAGYAVELADIERIAGTGMPGRPHIARALVEKGYAESVGDAFERFISRGAPFYVPLDKLSPETAADMIRQAGGKPVLAHPGLLRPGTFEVLAGRLKGAGFWGIEAYHPSHSDGMCRMYESEARRLGLRVTAGSDFHGALGRGAALGGETRGGANLQRSFEELAGEL